VVLPLILTVPIITSNSYRYAQCSTLTIEWLKERGWVDFEPRKEQRCSGNTTCGKSSDPPKTNNLILTLPVPRHCTNQAGFSTRQPCPDSWILATDCTPNNRIPCTIASKLRSTSSDRLTHNASRSTVTYTVNFSRYS
jgi:hypothetical protein